MKSRRRLSRISLEVMEKRELLAADLGTHLVPDSPVPLEGTAEIDFVEVAGSDSVAKYDADKWFIADSFSFGVEREMKESGEKGGTEDINIGVGELQESAQSTDAVMTSWSISGDADDRPTEEVTFYYNKIASPYSSPVNGRINGVVDMADYTIWHNR